ncbi:hypothetical protein [Methylobacterium oryzisoli]|uniref:hypothetical protein n=2 Tax=Methylobacterium oryzisoli TaxID=3385502 RepID=UPI003892BAD5
MAGECRPGAMRFVSEEGDVFEVDRTYYRGRPKERLAHQAYAGRRDGERIWLEVQAAPSMSATIVSELDRPGVNTLRLPQARIPHDADGDELQVQSGPLRGVWRLKC